MAAKRATAIRKILRAARVLLKKAENWSSDWMFCLDAKNGIIGCFEKGAVKFTPEGAIRKAARTLGYSKKHADVAVEIMERCFELPMETFRRKWRSTLYSTPFDHINRLGRYNAIASHEDVLQLFDKTIQFI